MNVWILLIATVLISGYSMTLKFAADAGSTLRRLLMFDGLFSLVACGIAFFITLPGGFSMPWLGYVFAFIYGATFLLTVVLNLLAVTAGPLSLVTLIVNLSLVFPVLYSVIFGNEGLSVPCIIGLVCFVACMFMLTDPKSDAPQEKKTGRYKWLLLSFAASACNGIGSTLVKAYMVDTDGVYVSQFNFASYLTAAVCIFAVLLLLTVAKPKKGEFNGYFNWKLLLIVALVGLFNFGGNYLVTLLANRMNAAVVYPVVQGGSIIITALISRIFLKEEVSGKKWAAIGIGTLSVVLLNF